MVTIPASLDNPVGMLTSYLTRPQKGPFIAIGQYGHGRGFWIDRTLREHGFEPVWLEDTAESAPSHDLEGRRLFAVYDAEKPTVPITVPSIVLTSDPDLRKGEEWRNFEWTEFPPPLPWDIERFLESLGAPPELANGNPNYASAEIAAAVFKATGIRVVSQPLRPTRWDQFRSGGDAPTEDGALPYWAAYAIRPPRNWEAVAHLGFRRRLSSVLFAPLLDSVRMDWPTTEPSFPEILKTPKAPRGTPKPMAEPKAMTVDLLPVSKGYQIDW